MMSGERKCGVALKIVIDKLLAFAPTSLAESWDNVGLLVEPVNQLPVSHILLTNDLTEDVMEEALSVKTNLIISYHPPIFSPLKKLTHSTWKERIILKCIAKDIALFSPHTSWDVVKGGVNDWLANAFESQDVKPEQNDTLDVYYIIHCNIFDLDAADQLVKDLHAEFTEPEFKYLGYEDDVFTIRCSKNVLESIAVILRRNSVVYTYFVDDKHTTNPKPTRSICRIRTLKNPINIGEAIVKLKKHIGTSSVQLALARGATTEHLVKTVAFAAGSGGSLLKNVRCDLKITGEASHHEVLDSVHNGSSMILTNHSNSERGFLYEFKRILAHELNDPNVQIDVSQVDSDPLKVH